MYDVYVTYVDKQDKKFLENVETDNPVYLHFFDMKSHSDIKSGWKVKNECAAKLDPFILIKDSEGKIVKAFYSESKTSPINQLILFLNASKSKTT